MREGKVKARTRPMEGQEQEKSKSKNKGKARTRTRAKQRQEHELTEIDRSRAVNELAAKLIVLYFLPHLFSVQFSISLEWRISST